MIFENQSGQPAQLHWIGYDGEQKGYGLIPRGATRVQSTYSGATWLISDKKGKPLGHFVAGSFDARAVIPKKK